jgi:hypothetical protein
VEINDECSCAANGVTPTSSRRNQRVAHRAGPAFERGRKADALSSVVTRYLAHSLRPPVASYQQKHEMIMRLGISGPRKATPMANHRRDGQESRHRSGKERTTSSSKRLDLQTIKLLLLLVIETVHILAGYWTT